MATTFFNSSGIVAVGNNSVGLVDTTNVAINPAKEDGNLATVVSRLDANLSTRATEATLSSLNTKFTTTANGIKVDGSAVTQPISGTVTADIKDSSGGSLTSTAGSLNVNVTGGSAAAEEHTVDSGGDLYIAGTTHAIVSGVRVVASSPSLTAGQFSALNVSLAGRLLVDGSGVTQPISAASLPLPTGAATETTLSGIKTDTDKLTFASTRLLTDSSGVTQPVSGTVTANIGTSGSLALDATVSAMSTKLPATLGQHAMAASLSVAIASDQSVIAANNSQWGGSATSLGQKAMVASVPVTLASDQSSIPVSQSGTWNITNISGTVSLPTGASTEATLSAVKTDLDKFTFASTRLLVDGSGVTQPVSAASLPLPIGAATSSKQPALGTAGTASADVISVQGVAGMTSLKVDGSGVTQPISGTVTVTQATGTNLHTVVDSGTVTANIGTTNGLALDATLTGGTQKTKIIDSAGTNVAAVSGSGALKVDGSGTTQPISAASLPLPTGAATEATLSAMSAKLPATLGQKTMANSMAVVISSDQSAIPVTISGDTITVSENIAQWGGVATSLGQKTMSASVPMTFASDQAALPVSQSGTWNITNISGTVSLPTGASTEATLAKLTVAQGTALGANTQALIGGSVTTAAPVYTTGQISPISLTTAGALRTDSSGTIQPVSGTVTANQGGTWNINNISGTISLPTGASTESTLASVLVDLNKFTFASTRLLVDGSGVTQPISAAALPLPAGASTSAKQPALGAAGIASTDVITIQGIAGMIALVVDGSGVTQPVSGTVTANAGSGNFTVVQATAANLNATVTGTVASTQSGTWTVQPGNTANTTPWLATINQGGNSATVTASNALKVDGSAVTQPVSGTVTANIGTSGSLALDATVSAMSAKLPATLGQHTMATSTSVALASDQSSIPVTGSGNFTVVQATAANLNATVTGTVTANIGTTNGLALDASVTGLHVSQGSTTSGQKGDLVLGAVTTAAPSYTTAQTSPLSLTTAGALRVDGSAVTQPVSGTVTAAQATAANLNATVVGSGNFTVVQATGTNLHTVVDSGSITVTQATPGNLNATVSQATAANLNATVTGTVTANIGTTGGLALDTSVNKLNVSQSTALGSNTGPMMQASVTTNAPSYSTGNINPLSLTPAGLLRVDNRDGTCTDNKLYLFNVDAFNLPTAGTETVAVLFKNPSGSGKTFTLRRLVAVLDGTGNADVTFKLYANPTTSANGSAVTVSSAFIGGGAGAASATPFTAPTASANGTRLMTFGAGSGTELNTWQYAFDGTLALAANNTLLFTGTPGTNNITISITLFWTEV